METMNHDQSATARRVGALVAKHPRGGLLADPARRVRGPGRAQLLGRYFAGRAAPLGLAPAEVVHAAFYNFGPGEVARHIPYVWENLCTPEQAIEARAARLHHGPADPARTSADSPAVVRAGDWPSARRTALRPKGESSTPG